MTLKITSVLASKYLFSCFKRADYLREIIKEANYLAKLS